MQFKSSKFCNLTPVMTPIKLNNFAVFKSKFGVSKLCKIKPYNLEFQKPYNYTILKLNKIKSNQKNDI